MHPRATRTPWWRGLSRLRRRDGCDSGPMPWSDSIVVMCSSPSVGRPTLSAYMSIGPVEQARITGAARVVGELAVDEAADDDDIQIDVGVVDDAHRGHLVAQHLHALQRGRVGGLARLEIGDHALVHQLKARQVGDAEIEEGPGDRAEPGPRRIRKRGDQSSSSTRRNRPTPGRTWRRRWRSSNRSGCTARARACRRVRRRSSTSAVRDRTPRPPSTPPRESLAASPHDVRQPYCE